MLKVLVFKKSRFHCIEPLNFTRYFLLYQMKIILECLYPDRFRWKSRSLLTLFIDTLSQKFLNKRGKIERRTLYFSHAKNVVSLKILKSI